MCFGENNLKAIAIAGHDTRKQESVLSIDVATQEKVIVLMYG